MFSLKKLCIAAFAGIVLQGATSVFAQNIVEAEENENNFDGFYEKHLPKPKLTPSQKVHMGVLDFVGKFKKSKRKEPIKSYMEITDLENHFVSIVIYYGNHKYSTIFRTIKL